MNILSLNCGSSSVKFKLVSLEADPHGRHGPPRRGEEGRSGAGGAPSARVLSRGLVEEIGTERSAFRYVGAEGARRDESLRVADHAAAVRLVLEALTDSDTGVLGDASDVDAVGHRVVHGGSEFSAPALVDDDVLAAIRRSSDLAPLHNPHNLRGIEIARDLLPRVPQAAVFDTAFHHDMPAEARTYALPSELRRDAGIRRFGFHGISHAFVARAAADIIGRPLEELRVVTCHLGNGASVAAVRGGRSVDTSMGMTPLEGLVMGTRCGDLDPAAVIRMVGDLGMSPDEASDVLRERSGLLGLSGLSSDMRALLGAVEEGNEDAELAVRVFCYRVRKYLGAYAAAMEGLDAVVFTGGIGENEPGVRARVCVGLQFLGIKLDEAANEAGAERIGTGSVDVLVIPTDEELAIALEAAALVLATA
ncbi:MAG: acetate/propionate family kinase [Candidatus Eisenbacteria bacterium]|nr:acetate/propionate family kinase [Candidatus Eisenbacteria bacterium]